MSLHRKAQLLVVITLAALLVIMYVILQAILLHSYTQLEQQSVENNVERLLNRINDDLSILSSQTADYAFWDSTYAFVQEYDNDYALEMTPETLANLSLNLTLWMNIEGKIVFHKTIDLASLRDTPLPTGLVDYLAAGSPLLRQPADKTGVQGIMMLADRPLMFAVQPILTSAQTGPAVGTLIFGRWMDAAYIQQILTALRQDVTLYRVNDPLLPDDARSALALLNGETTIITRPVDEQRIQGYTLLHDLNGSPALLLRLNMPRAIYMQGTGTLVYFLLAMVIVGLVFIILISILLQRTVITPLAKLSERITFIRQRADLSERINMLGKDELAVLAQNMNGMLGALDEAQQALKDANQQLELRVAQRTAQLSDTNDRLREEIAAREQMQVELAQARDQALEALQLKTQILANISHDARTPLNIIILRTQMLQSERQGDINPQQREMLDSILVNARQLLLFFNNLLQEAQLKVDKLQVKNVGFAPAALLDEVTALLAPLAERKGLTLESTVAPDVPTRLIGDPDKLSQILTNLVENAIKFTEHGSVSVHILRADQERWALQVSDSGIGIPDDAQSQIFDTFWQVDGSVTRQIGQGVGLGLAIVRQLTTLMGGEITVSSQAGTGSVFTVTLPLHKDTWYEPASIDN